MPWCTLPQATPGYSSAVMLLSPPQGPGLGMPWAVTLPAYRCFLGYITAVLRHGRPCHGGPVIALCYKRLKSQAKLGY